MAIEGRIGRPGIGTGLRGIPVGRALPAKLVSSRIWVSERWAPTTRAGVERTLVLAFLGIRAFDLAQMGVAVVIGSLAASTAPAIDASFMAVATAESALLAWWLLRRGSMLPLRWPLVADYVLSLVIVLSVPLYLAPPSRLAVWTMWAYPVTLSTVTLMTGRSSIQRDPSQNVMRYGSIRRPG